MSTKINTGMTLVEILSVIAVITIISMLTIPFYNNLQAKQEARLLPNILYQYLTQAKYNALTQRSNLVICSSQDLKQCSQGHWNNGFIMFLDKNQNKIFDKDDLILSQQRTNVRYGNLTWRGSLNLHSITFQGDTGLPRGSIGSFYYCSSELAFQHRVVLNMVGGVRNEILQSKC